MGFKKYFLIGMLGILVLIAGFMVLAKLSEQPAVNNTVVTNNTIVANNTTAVHAGDDVLASFSIGNDPNVTDSKIYIKIKEEGSDNISFSVSSLAIHNEFIDRWYVLNTKKTEVSNELLKSVIADSWVIYNNIYIYIPEVTVDVNGTLVNATMPLDKFYIPGDFVMLDASKPAYIELTFLKDKSIFETDSGYVFAPQIHIKSYVNSTESNLTEGKLWFEVTAGMNNKGIVHSGLSYNSSAK
jgi:hypothetical protein